MTNSNPAIPRPTDIANRAISFTPNLLRQYEERLVVAEKCGYDQITFEGFTVLLQYGQAHATAIRQTFNVAYGESFINWVVGPAPDFAQAFDLDELRKKFPSESMKFVPDTTT